MTITVEISRNDGKEWDNRTITFEDVSHEEMGNVAVLIQRFIEGGEDGAEASESG